MAGIEKEKDMNLHLPLVLDNLITIKRVSMAPINYLFFTLELVIFLLLRTWLHLMKGASDPFHDSARMEGRICLDGRRLHNQFIRFIISQRDEQVTFSLAHHKSKKSDACQCASECKPKTNDKIASERNL